jgi:hypothetical protein
MSPGLEIGHNAPPISHPLRNHRGETPYSTLSKRSKFTLLINSLNFFCIFDVDEISNWIYSAIMNSSFYGSLSYISFYLVFEVLGSLSKLPIKYPLIAFVIYMKDV